MRLLSRLAVAGLAGLAGAAASEPAEVYILSKSNPSASSSNPQIPRHVARDIVISRVGGQTDLGALPESITTDDALSYISQYGRPPKPLFGDAASSSAGGVVPSQLVIMLEGIDENNAKNLRKALKSQGSKPAFTIADPPSAKANKDLVDIELSSVSGSCDITAVINPYDSCWDGLSLVVKYDVRKNPSTLDVLTDNIKPLRSAISSDALETVLILLPESSRSSKHASWASDAPSELRRRVEMPISDIQAKPVVVPGSSDEGVSSPDSSLFASQASSKMNLGCFSTYNSCETATSNCSSHGRCIDKYAENTESGKGGDVKCFVCSCVSTRTYPENPASDQHTHWGGAYCQKIDVSSPFWLLAGTTIILVGLVTGSIAMLFNVGEEKLPGVIGAGVSRSK
ncbi:hypothetical protein M406DRAFT_291360 [Cryphonectria parasitica EP155]|uniref:Vacuolar sorting protein Vps3844 C-terminal domain-containing protein n=1 Tax=Cryphonectria parasitica (strain ATCC 38755 / EP155) TaxID=660469 RepID=A0A9P5CNG9_CRYP1|nr:uncharacterized protein M406DRAFT_291360 [Cryphonectria parasitica EP155]KAF3764312.1 hypothetical protein M406DRAFT_291360 [Cryphonectria parasitica EP155]